MYWYSFDGNSSKTQDFFISIDKFQDIGLYHIHIYGIRDAELSFVAGSCCIIKDFTSQLSSVSSDKERQYKTTLSSLSDENWDRGILKGDNKILLFNFNSKILEIIQQSSFLRSFNRLYKIEKIDFDSNWIRITVDKEASDDCAYPKEIEFVLNSDIGL